MARPLARKPHGLRNVDYGRTQTLRNHAHVVGEAIVLAQYEDAIGALIAAGIEGEARILVKPTNSMPDCV